MKVWIPVKEFSPLSRVVHHISALSFILALLLMIYINTQPTGNATAFDLHKSFGFIVFILYFGRITWMAWTGKPVALGTKIEQFLANMAHLVLYSILIIMPLSGLLINMAKAKDTVIFGLLTIPGFTERNSGLIEFASSIHSFLEIICYLLIAFHISASLFHHFVLKDETLSRMLWIKK